MIIISSIAMLMLSCTDREVHSKRGPHSWLTFGEDKTSMLFDYAVRSSQAQSGSFPDRFGCEERFKYVLHRAGIDPDACIRNSKQNITPRRFHAMDAAKLRAKLNVLSFNNKFAPLLHGGARVHAKIHGYLCDRGRISKPDPEVRRGEIPNFDALSN